MRNLCSNLIIRGLCPGILWFPSSPSSIAADTEMLISFIQNLCLSPPAKNSSSAVTTSTTITSSTFLLLCIRKISYIFSRTILSTSKIFLERTIELFSEVWTVLGISKVGFLVFTTQNQAAK